MREGKEVNKTKCREKKIQREELLDERDDGEKKFFERESIR
jgi:hypothetical protein